MNIAAAMLMSERATYDGAIEVPAADPTWAELNPAADAPDRLGPAWDALAADAAEPNVFAEHWFATAGLRNLAPADLQMLEVWQGDGARPVLVGILPLCHAPRYGRVPVRHVQNWLHFHSFLGSPLIRAGYEQVFWAALLNKLDTDPWASGFLHIQGLSEDGPTHQGLVAAAGALGRPCDTVHRTERALLASSLSPSEYYERTVRKKKRKELKRLSTRMSELGRVEFRTLERADELPAWCDAFLALERSGWKGKAGSALACAPSTEAFFREAVAGAFDAEKLDFLCLELEGRPIAMLVNLLAPPGSFSFKIAYDEEHSRFSPGVLIQIKNLRILDRGGIAWMDSCAVEDHPMINSLWGERRGIVRVTVPLSGFRRRAEFRLCRALEDASAALRRKRGNTGNEEADDDE
jgi:CelD/BcsL family acetyltransferase involved in cellulose biosynthesis